ncbi:phage tail-collar fiber domain-containing protein [Cronobacter dublinensis]|uniref:phage tail-collar fiber domain-containing protein n=1 Tax=Cronobacter dublinensis TaxID=413497 RepID=UPI000CFB3D0D|nr:phage tail protein [Cronobacter dublinensis]
MSQTAITYAFEQWKAQQAALGADVVLDEFVFASVPGLDTSAPVDRAETLPDASMIVHRQAVTKTGLVNENAVVYSVVLGATTGDFSFNWIGLVNRASGTLAMIVHAPVQQKIKTVAGQQGNVLTRSFVMEYNGAAKETAINTPADTWQIDFTARLDGADERTRVENIDLYGPAAFFGDGWLVAKSGAQYYVTPGAGYVAGLRSELPQKLNITVTTKPVSVWLDVAWRGSLTSVWSVESKVTVAETLANYEQNGVKHYVFAVARIEADGTITDLRPKGSLFLEKAKNFADVQDISKARGNLKLKGAALLDVGQKADTVAAGNDSRIVGALQKEQNLADVQDVKKARESLALKGAALLDVGKEKGTVAAGDDPRIVNAFPNTGGVLGGSVVHNATKDRGAGIYWKLEDGTYIGHFRKITDANGNFLGLCFGNDAHGSREVFMYNNGMVLFPDSVRLEQNGQAGQLYPDGNLFGTKWTGNGANGWIEDYFNRLFNARFISGMRVGAVEWSALYNGFGFNDVPGYFITGINNDGNASVDGCQRRPLQFLLNGQWFTVGG